MTFLAIMGCMDLLSILSEFGLVVLLADDGRGNLVAPPWFTIVIGLFSLLQFVFYVLTAVFFLRWLHRAYKNLIPLGARELKYSPGWACGYWFIPIMNLFRPYQALRELYHCSSPTDPVMTGDYASRLPSPGWLSGYWAAWITMNILSNIGTRLGMNASSIEVLKFSAIVNSVASVVGVIAAILAIRLVRSVDERQRARLSLGVAS